MENESTDKIYFYDYKYWTLDEICEMYRNLSMNKRKLFRDALAHYSLTEIIRRGNNDYKLIHAIWDLAGMEVDRMDLTNCDCGRVTLGYNRIYRSNLRKIINLTGKIVKKDDDSRINSFTNGEWFLNYLVCLTIGSSFEKDIIDDMFLIDYNSLSDDECLAITNNFMRYMRGEEIVFYDTPKQLKK